MKMTLLQMTQSILGSMNSDEVNSIGDTSESQQVAECIRTSYYNMLGRYDLPEHNQLFQLTPSVDSTKPVLMYKPDGVNRIEWLKYFDSNIRDGSSSQEDQFGAFSHAVNTDLQPSVAWQTTSVSTATIGLGPVSFAVPQGLNIVIGQYATAVSGINSMSGLVTGYLTGIVTINVTASSGSGTFSAWTISSLGGTSPPGYKRVRLLPVEDFLNMVSSFNTFDSDVSTFTLTNNELETGAPSNFTFNYKTDKTPDYWTILNNYFIIFDSFDQTQDSTLQASKTLAFGWVIPSFQMVDNFTPNLDEQQFPMLLNEAKSLAFLELKQIQHPKAEKEVMRQLVSLQKFKFTAHRPTAFEELPNFGRGGNRYYSIFGR